MVYSSLRSMCCIGLREGVMAAAVVEGVCSLVEVAKVGYGGIAANITTTKAKMVDLRKIHLAQVCYFGLSRIRRQNDCVQWFWACGPRYSARVNDSVCGLRSSNGPSAATPRAAAHHAMMPNGRPTEGLARQTRIPKGTPDLEKNCKPETTCEDIRNQMLATNSGIRPDMA